MTKGMPYDQTPLTDLLKNDLNPQRRQATICDEYQVNESNLMRKAIAQFITNIRTNPEKTSRYMCV